MATQRQIDANRRNALASTGPKTAEGRARSRVNAIKHGMAAEELIGDNQRADFDDRRAKWAEEIAPSTAEGEWAFDRAVAASFRIERCERRRSRPRAPARTSDPGPGTERTVMIFHHPTP